MFKHRSGLKYKKCCINKNQEILNEPQVDLNNSFVKKFLQGGGHSEIMKNKESLEGLLNESKIGNGTYSLMISEHSNSNEFIELINKSIIPDENKGLVSKRQARPYPNRRLTQVLNPNNGNPKQRGVR
jgi:hypothetical protein